MDILYTIGDSFVFRGPQYTTWSKLLANKLNYIDANNGVAGTSNDRSYRSVIRDVSRVETEGKLWTEFTGDIDCKLENLFIIVGWTSPSRFEWYDNGEFLSSRFWKNSTFTLMNNSRIDFSFSDDITIPLSDMTNSLVRFFNQILTLKNFLENKKIKHIFYNTFFPFNGNTIEYFETIIEEIEQNKPKSLVGFDNPSTFYSLKSLWKQVPEDYKKYNQAKYVTSENLDETLHPTLEGNKLWSDFLYEKVNEYQG